MTDLHARVDAYLADRLIPPDPVLDAVISRSRAAGLPDIAVAPLQGRMLTLLARLCQARRILEIGTLGGYSGICLGRALPPDGRLVTLEYDPRHAAVAQDSFAAAGLSERVEIRVGRAIDSLVALQAEAAAPFDLIFIDADKPSNPDYLRLALDLSRPGTLIICDNVVRRGAIVGTGQEDANVLGIRRMLDMIAEEPRLYATALQTVGEKSHDGLLFARVEG